MAPTCVCGPEASATWAIGYISTLKRAWHWGRAGAAPATAPSCLTCLRAALVCLPHEVGSIEGARAHELPAQAQLVLLLCCGLARVFAAQGCLCQLLCSFLSAALAVQPAQVAGRAIPCLAELAPGPCTGAQGAPARVDENALRWTAKRGVTARARAQAWSGNALRPADSFAAFGRGLRCG